jgi:hypothetical protein
MNAWISVRTTWPTWSVPGISSSDTLPRALKGALGGASIPIPGVTKKKSVNEGRL